MSSSSPLILSLSWTLCVSSLGGPPWSALISALSGLIAFWSAVQCGLGISFRWAPGWGRCFRHISYCLAFTRVSCASQTLLPGTGTRVGREPRGSEDVPGSCSRGTLLLRASWALPLRRAGPRYLLLPGGAQVAAGAGHRPASIPGPRTPSLLPGGAAAAAAAADGAGDDGSGVGGGDGSQNL